MTATTNNRLLTAKLKLLLLATLQQQEPTPATAAMYEHELSNIARLTAQKGGA